jgi:hypothetical protein
MRPDFEQLAKAFAAIRPDDRMHLFVHPAERFERNVSRLYQLSREVVPVIRLRHAS